MIFGSVRAGPSPRDYLWTLTRAKTYGQTDPQGDQISSGTAYGLANSRMGEFVGYGSRSHGINLVWAGGENPLNITITTVDGNPLNLGERFSLKVRGASFVQYGKRDYGINLVWSKDIAPEWELRSDESGAAKAGQTVRLYNVTARSFVRYEHRKYGINLGWGRP